MRVIVDANIVFSGILNSNGKIGDLLINSGELLEFVAPDFLRKEIFRHHSRLCRISKMTSDQVREAEFYLCKGINFISEELIKKSAWTSAGKLVSNVDPNDVTYIAFAKHFRCKLWSGDKKLITSLSRIGFRKFITTDELFQWRQIHEKKRKRIKL